MNKDTESLTLPTPSHRWDAIPDELRQLPQWVNWQFEKREGKLTKVPYTPGSNGRALTSDPTTWASFDVAVADVNDNIYAGIGFVFSEKDAYIGIDLDSCRNPETGDIQPWAREIINQINSYAEISVSGAGIHIFAKSAYQLDKGRRDNSRGLEMYCKDRYFVTTGHHLGGTPSSIEDRTAEIAALYNSIFGLPEIHTSNAKTSSGAVSTNTVGEGGEEHRNTFTPAPPNCPPARDDETILRMAREAANADKFCRLFDGDMTEYENDHSRADMALCCMLTIYTHDPDQIDRIFRKSALFRDKWDSKRADSSYGRDTIQKALRLRNGQENAQSETHAAPKPIAPEVVAPEPELPAGNSLGIYTPDDLKRIVSDLISVEPVVAGMIPSRSIILFVGDSGLGKSPFTYQLSLSVATGKPFLGHSVVQGPVIYLDFENSLKAVDDIMTQQCKFLRLPTRPETLKLWNANYPGPSWRDEDRDGSGLVKLAEQFKPSLIIVDSLSTYRPGAEKDNTAANTLVRDLRRVSQLGPSILVVHHRRKQSRESGEETPFNPEALHRWFQETRGAIALINSSDVRLGASRSQWGGGRDIAFQFSGFERVTGTFPMLDIVRRSDESGEPLGYDVARGFDRLTEQEQAALSQVPETFSFNEFTHALGKKGKASPANMLRRLKAMGVIEQSLKGGLYQKINDPVSEFSGPDGPVPKTTENNEDLAA